MGCDRFHFGVLTHRSRMRCRISLDDVPEYPGGFPNFPKSRDDLGPGNYAAVRPPNLTPPNACWKTKL